MIPPFRAIFAGTLQLQQLLQLRNTLLKQMYKSRLGASVVIRGSRMDASECRASVRSSTSLSVSPARAMGDIPALDRLGSRDRHLEDRLRLRRRRHRAVPSKGEEMIGDGLARDNFIFVR